MRRRASAVRSVAFLLVLLALMAVPAFARDPFSGYAEEVRVRATRVVAEASPGREKALVGEVRSLHRAMLAHGILSINALPDLVFEKALAGKWRREAASVLRIVAPVSSLSVPMWAWLVKDDLARLNIGLLLDDFNGLVGAVRQFGPALMGYAAWLLSVFCAAACWFCAWAGAALFLRGRPSLEADLARLLGKAPWTDYAAPAGGALLFLLPLALGAGIAVAAPFWLLLVALYLRRKELLIMAAAILLLGGLIGGGGILQTLVELDAGSGRSGWLAADGYPVTPERAAARGPEEVLSVQARSWIERFERARAAMQAGDAAGAERAWTALLDGEKGATQVLNNRGIVRARQGKVDLALADFEEASARNPTYGPALWNSYQIYLERFHIERARMIQPLAWERIQELEPYKFRPAELDQGEWVASTLPVPEIWRGYMEGRRGWLPAAEDNVSFRPFFRPLSARAILWLLGAVVLLAAAGRIATAKLWTSGTCRACGIHLMILGSRESADLCTPCRSQVGAGIREGEERSRRILSIAMHRRFVWFTSVLVPGSGALWAGKEIRAMFYGMALSVAMASVSASLAGSRAGSPLVVELQSLVWVWAAGAAAALWLSGAAWGIWSFAGLLRRCNIAGIKR